MLPTRMCKAIPPMKRHVSVLAIPRRFKTWATVLLAVYPLLVMLAAACPLAPTSDSHHHAHAHHQSSAHTLLCNWSCQLSSYPPFVSLWDRTLPGVVLIDIPTVLTQPLLTETDILCEMRGPPVPLQV